MDKAIGIVTLAFMVTALSVVVSRRTQTAKVLTAGFNGIASLQRAAVSPLK
jgi:hypothetical protein